MFIYFFHRMDLMKWGCPAHRKVNEFCVNRLCIFTCTFFARWICSICHTLHFWSDVSAAAPSSTPQPISTSLSTEISLSSSSSSTAAPALSTSLPSLSRCDWPPLLNFNLIKYSWWAISHHMVLSLLFSSVTWAALTLLDLLHPPALLWA